MFEFFLYVIVFAGLALAIANSNAKRAQQAAQQGKFSHHCLNCGTDFVPRAGPTRGSGGIEIVLWLFLIVPGLIYSIWRRSGPPDHSCPTCGRPHAVPFNSIATFNHKRQLGQIP